MDYIASIFPGISAKQTLLEADENPDNDQGKKSLVITATDYGAYTLYMEKKFDFVNPATTPRGLYPAKFFTASS